VLTYIQINGTQCWLCGENQIKAEFNILRKKNNFIFVQKQQAKPTYESEKKSST